MGIGVVMDSFGLGYSSLNILDKIPVESIKLDKVFIKNNIFAKNEEVILNGIIDIAKKLHKSITSLGVETEEQNAFLCKSGCDVIQGNFYSVPLDGKQLAEYITPFRKFIPYISRLMGRMRQIIRIIQRMQTELSWSLRKMLFREEKCFIFQAGLPDMRW